MSKLPNFLTKFLKLTIDDSKIPTDTQLDRDIRTLSWYMHYVYPLTKSIIKRKLKNFFFYKWKLILKKLSIVVLILISFYLTYLLFFKPSEDNVNYTIIYKKVEKIEKDMLNNPIPQENLNFMITFSLLESNATYDTIGGYNKAYWGAYQFGELALKEVGLSGMPKETFLHNPVLQNWAMNELMKKNYYYLKDIIIEYKIPTKGGVKIGMHLVTVSGLIAAAHLVGASPVKTFFKTNGQTVPKDGNNKPMTDYFQLNNFELNFK